MLKTRVTNNDINLNTLINSEDYSSDRDYYNSKLLNLGALSVINSINDSEVYEYKPDSVSELNFNVFFLKYMQDNVINEITPYMESDFTSHVTKTKIALGLITSNGSALQNGFNNVFETRQSGSNLREPMVRGESGVTRLSALKGKPYVVSDYIGQSILKIPNETGLPIFYNSYTIPFWDKKNDWFKEKLLYKNKPYFNNSFLLIEFYDSPSALNQNRVISIPIFVSGRYNIKEKTNNGVNSVIYERPCFKLKEGFDGFSFFFLNNYIKTDFYARFSFWDSANGRKIELLPSSIDEKEKKWFQKVEDFKQENNYLKYILDYATKTYKIYEYNNLTNDYDIHRSNFDLYELSFDRYYENIFVPNDIPYDVSNIKPIIRPNNPLKFNIRNLYTNLYLGNATSTFNVFDYQPDKTYLWGSLKNANQPRLNTGKFIDGVKLYLDTLPPNKTINQLPITTFKFPIIDNFKEQIVINGFVKNVRKFIAYSVDTEIWRVRKLSLQDVSVILDDTQVFDKTYYVETESSFDVQEKHKISESLTLLINNLEYKINVGQDYNAFIKKIMYSVEFIPQLVKYISSKIDIEISKHSGNGIFNREFTKLTALMEPIIQYTNVNIPQSNSDWGAMYINIDSEYNEGYNSYVNRLAPYVEEIISAYTEMQNNNDPNCALIKSLIIDLLSNVGVYDNNAVNELVKLIYSNYRAVDHKNLISDYLTIANNVTFSTQDIVELNGIYLGGYDYVTSFLPSRPNIRDSLFNVVITQTGDQYISKNETLTFDMNIIIGKNTIPLMLGKNKITVIGKLRVSIVDGGNNIKNIFIPIKTTINVGEKPRVNPSTIVPELPSETINRQQ